MPESECRAASGSAPPLRHYSSFRCKFLRISPLRAPPRDHAKHCSKSTRLKRPALQRPRKLSRPAKNPIPLSGPSGVGVHHASAAASARISGPIRRQIEETTAEPNGLFSGRPGVLINHSRDRGARRRRNASAITPELNKGKIM